MNQQQQPGGLNLDAIRNTLSQRKQHKPVGAKAGGDGKRWYQLPDGTEQIRLRFLPQYNERGVPGRVIYYHYSISLPEELKADKYPTTKIICMSTFNQQCPYCEMLREYEGRIELDKMAAQGAAYFNILVLEDPTKPPGHKEYPEPTLPHVMRASAFTLDWLYNNIMNKDIGDITDPRTGANVTLYRKSNKGAYERQVARQSQAIGDEAAIVKILENMYDLDKFNSWLPPDEAGMRKIVSITAATKLALEERVISLSSQAPMMPTTQHTGEPAAYQPPTNQLPPPTTAAANQGYLPPTATQPAPVYNPPPETAPISNTATKMPTTQSQEAAPALNTSSPPQTINPAAPTTQAAAPATQVATQAGAVARPAGSPDCYANPQVFNPESQKCLLCPFDFNCEETIKGTVQ